MKKRRSLALAILVALLLGGGVAWWKLRGGGGKRAEVAAGDDPWAGDDTEAKRAILARKHAARGNAPADTRPATLAGRVTREADGSGVAGAVVSVTVREFGGSLFATAGGGRSVVVVADASGAWTATGVTPGPHVVSAAAADLLPATLSVDVAPGSTRTGIDLALAAGGAAVTGTVSDIGGGGIGQARVTARPYGIAALDSSDELVAITRDDGTYRLQLPDGSWHATVTHDEYASATREFELRGHPATLDFQLTPGGVIRGVVVAKDTGKPVPGTRVSVSGGHGDDNDGDLGGLGGTPTDDTGAFTLRGLASGSLSLRASGRGYASADPTVVDVAIGEELDGVRVVVDRAYTISGFVVRDGKNGEGIPGVRVGVFSIAKETGMFAQQPSADDGYFEILGVRPASYMIAALGEGVMLEIGRPVAVVDRDLTDVLVTMKTGATLSGKVTPPAVASLSLEIDPTKVGLGNMFDVAKAALVHGASDATGAFALKSAPPGTFTLVAQTTDGSTGKLPVTITTADQTGLVIALEARGSISGRVVDPGGAAVAGVTVQAQSVGGGFRMDMDSGPNHAVTAADGSYEVSGLDPGDISLTVEDEDGPLAWAEPIGGNKQDSRDSPVRKKLDGAEELTGVTLAVEARDGVIRGLVLDASGKPAPDVWITARSTQSPWMREINARTEESKAQAQAAEDKTDDKTDGKSEGKTEVKIEVKAETGDDAKDEGGEAFEMWGRGKSALTDEGGRFTITKLRRGTYSVVAEPSKGGTRAQKNGVKTGDTVTLTLERLGSLAGAVTRNGAPVADYEIQCRGPSGDPRRHVTASDGAYTIERLAPGTYHCDVQAADGTASGSASVSTGGARLDLTLVGWASVTGIVVDKDGKPLAGLKVAVSVGDRDDGGAFAELITGGGPTTDDTGRFEVGRLAAGKGELLVFDVGQMAPVVSQQVELAGGERKDLGTLTASAPDPR
ncbi:MAG TPA: carboxypeptidase regulatory-like domain-containing protein [Kofleriaceae bacterium]|nr:carboxypeptidase regulatory-like domain-containing protein [Kofleriaceae bacterium]